MSNNSKILLKMNAYFSQILSLFEFVAHPAAGKAAMEKTTKRSSSLAVIPKATPDSLNMRGLMKKEDSFRRNPAP